MVQVPVLSNVWDLVPPSCPGGLHLQISTGSTEQGILGGFLYQVRSLEGSCALHGLAQRELGGIGSVLDWGSEFPGLWSIK